MAKTTLQDDMMPLTDLKRMLNLAASDALPCVIALTASKDDALLLLDRKMKCKKLATKLKSEKGREIEVKSVRFGEIEVQSDGSTVSIRLNKAPMKPSPLLVGKLLKRAGYGSVTFAEDESLEGDEADAAGETAAPEAAAAAPDAPTAAAVPAPPLAPEPANEPVGEPVSAPEAERGDAGLAPGQLEALARRVKPAIAATPAAAPGIVAALRALQASAAGGGDASAQARILLDLLDRAESASASTAATPTPDATSAAGAPPSIDRTQGIVERADDIWRQSSERLRGTLDRLKASMLDAYADQPEVQAAIRGKLGGIDQAFAWMDDRLPGALAAARAATDAAERRRHARDGVAIAAEYVASVKANAMLNDLDGNPFGVDTKFAETIDKVIPAVTKLMQAA